MSTERQAVGYTPQVATICKVAHNLLTDCPISYLYYLSSMGEAQKALGYLQAGGVGHPSPVSPQYPPTDTATELQFQQLMGAIGFGIGAAAAHETGHELFLPSMDCNSAGHANCPEDRIFQNGVGTGDNEWFYGNLPGAKIHWSDSAVCALEKYLLGHPAPAPCN